MRSIIISICSFVLSLQIYCQVTEMECTLIRKSNSELIVKPAHYDESIFPTPNQQVTFSLYLSDDLTINKNPGYYELGLLTISKWSNESKSITLKIPDNWDGWVKNPGISPSSLHHGDKIKLLWKN